MHATRTSRSRQANDRHPLVGLRRAARRPSLAISAAAIVALAAIAGRAEGADLALWKMATDRAVRTMAQAGNSLYIGGDFGLVGPNSGGGAPLDITTATPTVPTPRIEGTVSAVVSDGAGGWFIGGTFTTVGGLARSNLAHLLADGTVSPWSPDADGPVFALAMSGPRLLVGGGFTAVGGQTRHGLADLDATSGTAGAWNPSPNSFVSALAVVGPTIYAGGGFSTIGGQTRNAIAALSLSTSAASSWSPNANGQVAALAVSGSIVYAGGSFTSIGGQSRNFAAALDAVTGSATNWDPDADRPVSALALDGPTIYLGGAFNTIQGQSHLAIAAVDAVTGAPRAWNPHLDDNSGTAQVLALALIGSTVYACGSFITVGGQPHYRLAAIDATSGAPTAWNPRSIDEGGARIFALARSGATIYVGGTFRSMGCLARDHLAVLDSQTGAVTAIAPNPDGPVRGFAVAGSTIYIAGDFANLGGQARVGVAALDAASGAVTPWNANADGGVGILALGGSSLYAAGEFSHIGGQPRAQIAALDTVTAAATATSFVVQLLRVDPFFGPVPGTVNAMGVMGSTLYLCGAFDFCDNQSRKDIAAVDATTGDLTPWNPAPNANGQQFGVSTLTVDDALVYAGGSFTNIGGLPRIGLVELLPATGAATFWNPDPTLTSFNAFTTMAVSGSILYVGGFFSWIGGTHRNGLAALDVQSGKATDWDAFGSSGSGGPFALALGGSHVYVNADPGIVAFPVSGTVSVPPGPMSVRFGLTSLPNPARTNTTLRFALPTSGPVELAVYDPAGRRVARLLDSDVLPAGPHDVPFILGTLKPGLYFARLKSGAQHAVHKMMVVQ